MKDDKKTKQIVIRFDNKSYDMIKEYAEAEHRGIGEFVRHVTLNYIENFAEAINKKNERR